MTNAAVTVFVVSVTDDEREEIRAAFVVLGYDVGTIKGLIAKSAVEAFQGARELTVDGKIGRATLATLQREIDAKSNSKTAAATSTGGAGLAAGGEAVSAGIDPASVDLSGHPIDAVFWIGGGVVVIGAAYAAYVAWTYRDLVAARVHDKLPRLAAYLRSI